MRRLRVENVALVFVILLCYAYRCSPKLKLPETPEVAWAAPAPGLPEQPEQEPKETRDPTETPRDPTDLVAQPPPANRACAGAPALLQEAMTTAMPTDAPPPAGAVPAARLWPSVAAVLAHCELQTGGEQRPWGGGTLLLPAGERLTAETGEWHDVFAVSLDDRGEPLCRWGTSVRGLLTSADSRRATLAEETGPGVTKLSFRALEPGDYTLEARTAFVDYEGLAGKVRADDAATVARAPATALIGVRDSAAGAELRRARGASKCGFHRLNGGEVRGRAQWRRGGSCAGPDGERWCASATGAALVEWTWVPDDCVLRQHSPDEMWAALDGRWIVGEGDGSMIDNLQMLYRALGPCEFTDVTGGKVRNAGKAREQNYIVSEPAGGGERSFHVTSMWNAGVRAADDNMGFAAFAEQRFLNRFSSTFRKRGAERPDAVFLTGVVHDVVWTDAHGLDAWQKHLHAAVQEHEWLAHTETRLVWRSPPALPRRAHDADKHLVLEALVQRELCAAKAGTWGVIDYRDMTYSASPSPGRFLGRAVVDMMVAALPLEDY